MKCLISRAAFLAAMTVLLFTLPPRLGMAAAPDAKEAASKASYVFGVVPQFERRQLYAIWLPVLEEVSKRSGVPLHMTTSLSVHDFEIDLNQGKFDLVYTNPYHVLKERKDTGYVPLVRGAAPLKGILMVPKASPLVSPMDLEGKTVAVPTPNALGASIMIQADLEKLYGVHVKVKDVKTHASVFLHVANGLVDAGGSVQKMLNEQKPEVRDGLRVIYTTRDMPSHPVAAHPRVGRAVRERIEKAFLDMAQTPEGAALLEKIPMMPLVATTMDDYLPMEDWGLDKFWDTEGELK